MEYKDPEDFVKAYNEYLDDPVLDNCKNYPVFNWFDNFLYDFTIGKYQTVDEDKVFDMYDNNEILIEAYYALEPKGYHGIQKEAGTSNDIHLDSIKKGDYPICHMSYNEDGYQSHCRMYKEYKEWEKNRNPQRYLENLEKDFDRKNMMHCIRLLNMGIEIAKTGQVNVDRTNIDRDFLLNIRLGNTTYEEIIEFADNKKKELEEAIKNCDFLPQTVDSHKINDLLIKIRSNFF
jgi:hypothetical protein